MICIKRVFVFLMAILMVLMTAACVIVPIDPDAGDGPAGSAVAQAVDVVSYLEEYWEPYILPEIYERRVDLSYLIDVANSEGWEFAGEEYGDIRGDIGASYTFIVYGTAVVQETNTESRNGFIIVQFEDQDSYEIRISIGPALSGSAIRDAIQFIDFNHFVNQVDFAKLATELNRIGNERALGSADIFFLDGKTIEFTGAFSAPNGGNEISIMPIFLEVK
jgi:predicted lipoprotein